MQTFSSMSRDSTIKNILNSIVFLLFYVFYIVLSSMYILFPPLLGVLFAKYMKDVKDRNSAGVVSVFVACLFFEVEKSNVVGVVFLLFVCLSFLLKKMLLFLREEGYFFGLIYVLLPYLFYFLFLQTFMVFKGQFPIEVDLLLLWYLFCEGVIVLWKR